jgi:hypothetical protein
MGTAAKPTRANRTITVDFRDDATYYQLLGDGKAFGECVLAFILSIGFQLTHKASCSEGGSVTRHSGIVNLSRLIPSSGKRVCHLDPSYPLGSPLRTRDLTPTLESMAYFLVVMSM